MPREIILPQSFKERDTFGIFEDFPSYVTTHDWASVLTDGGAATVGDAVGGILSITMSDGSVADNDQSYIKGAGEIYKFANNKPIVFEARVQYTEANTDDANIFVGLTDAVAAELLIDDGAGTKATASTACFYKVDGETYWRCKSQIGAGVGKTDYTPSTTSTPNGGTVAVTAGGSSYQTLRIEVNPFNSTTADVIFKIDTTGGTSNFTLVAHHKLVYTNATEMQIGIGGKNGGANLETLLVDYVGCYQVR